MRNFLNGRYFALLLLSIIGLSICTVAYFNEDWISGPDNYWHYYFSKYAFQYPHFFLHHWGKPFFILLTAPVSQLGFYALNVFNIICGLLSAYVAYKWCNKLNLGYSFMVVIIILFTPIYLVVIQSALTEPLFSLILIYSAYLLFYEKYLFGAVVASTLMYSRTEGLFIIMIFLVYLIITKKYKFIPFLATSFIVYSFVGYFTGHQFLWYFTEIPYKAISPYGCGTWMHFISTYKLTFGKIFFVLFLIGLIVLIKNIFYKKQKLFGMEIGTEVKLIYLVFIPCVSYFVFHMYAWAEGKFASAGELRVMACIVPLAAVIGMFAVNLAYSIRFPFLRVVVFVVIIQGVFHYAFRNYEYPLKAKGSEKAEIEASKWFKQYREANSMIFYAHPGIIFHCDYNPFDKQNRECFSFMEYVSDTLNKSKKCYYIWDSQFSEFSCQNKLSDIENLKGFVKVKEFRERNFNVAFFENQ